MTGRSTEPDFDFQGPSLSERAATMLTAYAELVKMTGRFAEEHYIPEVEELIEQLRESEAARRAPPSPKPLDDPRLQELFSSAIIADRVAMAEEAKQLVKALEDSSFHAGAGKNTQHEVTGIRIDLNAAIDRLAVGVPVDADHSQGVPAAPAALSVAPLPAPGVAALRVPIADADDPIVGHKTFHNEGATDFPFFRTEPLRKSEADVMIAAAEAAEAQRAADMPTEEDAARAMWSAYQRLIELGWRETSYGPTGKTVRLIEPGSSGIHVGSRHKPWPSKTWWIEAHSDLWPGNPCLFKPLDESAAIASMKKDQS